MKTFELFESKAEAKEIIARAIEQAERDMPDIITWGPESSQWQGDEGDWIGYEEGLVDVALSILKEEQWYQSLSAQERWDLTPLIFRMVRRRVIGLRRQEANK